MDMFVFMDGAGRSNEMEKELTAKLEKAKRELRRRLMDTDKIKFGGVLNLDGLKLMREGGDVELQMVALLYSQLKMRQVITDDWSSQEITQEDSVFRSMAIHQFAQELFRASVK